MSILRPMMRPIMRPMIRPVFRGSAFDPLSLFANGEQGAWYDPSDLTTLYQDSAGTTPVTADGDPVGLMLDKSQGLALGPELVVNGDFSAGGAEWVTSGVASITGGQIIFAIGSDTQIAYQSVFPANTSKIYRLTMDVSITSGAVEVHFGGEPKGAPITASGSFSTLMVGDGSNNGNLIIGVPDGETSTQAAVDNISVRELPGNHATQATSASRPIYRTDGTIHWLEGDGVDDYMTLGDTLSLGTGGIIQVHAFDTAVAVLSGKSWAAEDGERFFFSAHTAGHILRGATDTPSFDLTYSLSGGAKKVASQWITRGPSGFHQVRENTELKASIAFQDTSDLVSAGRPFWLFAYPNSGSTAPVAGYLLSGKWFGCVIRLGNNSADDLAKVERYIAKKSGVPL